MTTKNNNNGIFCHFVLQNIHQNNERIFRFKEMSSLLYCAQKFVANLLFFEENFGSFSKIIANKWQIYLGMLVAYSYFRNLGEKKIKTKQNKKN
jgi:hypothetical protein